LNVGGKGSRYESLKKHLDLQTLVCELVSRHWSATNTNITTRRCLYN
jgi:hypothetical protein